MKKTPGTSNIFSLFIFRISQATVGLLVVTGKKNVGCSRGFFSQLISSGLDVNISAHEFYG
jgi:hypothetical protein